MELVEPVGLFERVDVDLAPVTRRAIARECLDFLEYSEQLLNRLPETYSGYDYTAMDLAGHDFWLTRNGHGAGFWDRGLGQLGDDLTDAAKSFGSCDAYVGDDNSIYVN